MYCVKGESEKNFGWRRVLAMARMGISALCGGSGGLSPPDGGWGKAPVLPRDLARAVGERHRARAAR